MSGLRLPGWLLIAGCSLLLLALASGFDFFCDDAFIVLRYAQNVARHGAPVYNLGERVEGYTSLSWMLLAVPGAWLGLPLPRYVQGLGALSGVGLLWATWALYGRLRVGGPGLGLLVLLAVALSAPVAAWTLGGLETPLFAALVTLSFALAIDLGRDGTPRTARRLGLVLGLCALTRPEGMLVAGAIGTVLAAPLLRSSSGRASLAWLAGLSLAIVAAHVAWRWSYYGYPLPNTFYVKSSGDASALRARGLGYLQLALRELQPFVPASVALGLIFAGRLGGGVDGRGRVVLAWIGRLLWPAYALYVGAVGGDFLDMYRFFVPLLPLGFVLAASAFAERLGAYVRGGVAFAIGAALVLGYGADQHALAQRTRQLREPARVLQRIETIGWSRLYALRWAALGRWIARHAHADDWMTVGAAGAMPYYAGLRNLDTFGLCDEWVAHHAPIVGDRPGHQRFAPLSYILSKRPAFLLHGKDFSSDSQRPLQRDARWEALGYVWVEARIEAAEFDAPSDFFHYFLMRADRANEQAGSRWLRSAL